MDLENKVYALMVDFVLVVLGSIEFDDARDVDVNHEIQSDYLGLRHSWSPPQV